MGLCVVVCHLAKTSLSTSLIRLTQEFLQSIAVALSTNLLTNFRGCQSVVADYFHLSEAKSSFLTIFLPW